MFAFLPISPSKGVVFVTRCGDIRSVLMISATLEAILKVILFGSIFVTPSRRLSLCISLSSRIYTQFSFKRIFFLQAKLVWLPLAWYDSKLLHEKFVICEKSSALLSLFAGLPRDVYKRRWHNCSGRQAVKHEYLITED